MVQQDNQKRRKKICARIAFSNPSSDVDQFTPLLKKTVVQNLESVLRTFPTRAAPLRNVTTEWVDRNLLIDYWYLDYKDRRLQAAQAHPTLKRNGGMGESRVRSNGRSVTSRQTPGKERLENGETVPFVLIMIYVSNYIPLESVHATHMIAAFKFQNKLFCFNPWGVVASQVHTPDSQIWTQLAHSYGCNHIEVYTGPNLQEEDKVGACGVLSFTFGTHMYVEAVLSFVGLVWYESELFNSTIARMFDIYQPAFGPVLKGLQLPHMQNQLTSTCWKAFQICVDARGIMSVKRNDSRRKQPNRPEPMQHNAPRRFLRPPWTPMEE